MPEISFVETETKSAPCFSVIWLHGLGADGSDFEPIVPELRLGDLPGIRFIFPDAPYRSVTCNGGYEMRAWYDIISLEPHSREIDERGLLASMSIVRQLIACEGERGIPSHRVFLAGFSQGGAVAYSTALTHPDVLAGVIALSTYIPSVDLVSSNLSEANRAIPILAVHGIRDGIVSPSLGEQAVELLTSHGYAVQWQTYPMGHEVCHDEVKAIGDWLRKVIS